MAQYYVYSWPRLGGFTLAQLRTVARAWGIATEGRTRAQLRQTVMHSAKNLSSVPHPLIPEDRMPV